MKKKIIFGSVAVGTALVIGYVIVNQYLESRDCECLAYKEYANVPVNFDLDKVVGSLDPRDKTHFVGQAQAFADTLSWKTFVAINWPADWSGRPDSTKCFGDGSAKTVWQHWFEVSTILPHGNPRIILKKLPNQKPLVNDDGKVPEENRIDFFLNSFKNRELGSFKSIRGDKASKVPPVVDQNGNKTYFQSYYNDIMSSYIEKTNIKSLDGLREFVKTFPYADENFMLRVAGKASRINRIHFPVFSTSKGGSFYVDEDSVPDSTVTMQPSKGSIMIKMAWKVISGKDDPSRFYTRKAKILEGKKWRSVKVGLVAMHIAVRYSKLPQWLWATFEHTDNVPEIINGNVNALPGKRYSYYHSKYGNNVNKQLDVSGKSPLARQHKISDKARQLNDWMHEQMVAIDPKSVWQYYDLVGSQWPFLPKLFPNDQSYIGIPEPHYLSNAVIENFGQNSSCLSCHSKAGVKTSVTKGKPDSVRTNFAWAFKRLNER